MATKFDKTATGKLNYLLNWADWIGSDTINASSWDISPSGLTIVSSDFSLTTTTIVVSGGTVGTEYCVTNTITTAGDLITSRSFTISLVEKRSI